jgi:metal-responsive CopG/Arc/MetJ family transcriptional regulator
MHIVVQLRQELLGLLDEEAAHRGISRSGLIQEVVESTWTLHPTCRLATNS